MRLGERICPSCSVWFGVNELVVQVRDGVQRFNLQAFVGLPVGPDMLRKTVHWLCLKESIQYYRFIVGTPVETVNLQ